MVQSRPSFDGVRNLEQEKRNKRLRGLVGVAVVINVGKTLLL